MEKKKLPIAALAMTTAVAGIVFSTVSVEHFSLTPSQVGAETIVLDDADELGLTNEYVAEKTYSDTYSTYVFTNVKAYDEGLCTLGAGGTLTKIEAAKGLTSITVEFKTDVIASVNNADDSTSAMTLETSFEVGGETTTYNIYNGVPTKICGNYFTLNSIVTTYIETITLDYSCTTESLGHNLTHRAATSSMIEHDYCENCTKHFVDGEIVDTMLEFSLPTGTANSKFATAESTLNGHYATAFTVPAGTAAGTYESFTPNNGVTTRNDRLLLLGNTPQAIVFFAENTGTEDIEIAIAFDDWGPKDESGTFLIPAGETVRYDYFDNSSISTAGPWLDVVVKSNVTTDTTVKLYGYVDSCDKTGSAGLTTNALAATTKFKVGETFNHDGLLLKLEGADTAKVVNYTTNWDGHEFAHEDVGTQKVNAVFGVAKYSYEILVWEEHQCKDNLVHTPEAEPTPFADGTYGYYTCSQDGNVFEDANATIPTTVAARSKSSDQWITVTPHSKQYNWWLEGGYQVLDTDPIFNAGPVLAREIRPQANSNPGAGWDFKTVRVSDGEQTEPLQNTNFPSVVGSTVKVKWYIKNTGNTNVNLDFYIDENESNSKMNLTVGVGEEKVVEHTYVESNGGYGWLKFVLKEGFTNETSLITFGYISVGDSTPVDGVNNTIEFERPANKLTFKVGETFDYTGLTGKIAVLGNKSGTPFVFKFTTNYDGHVFTASDIGEHTVVARFGGDTITYTINVTA